MASSRPTKFTASATPPAHPTATHLATHLTDTLLSALRAVNAAGILPSDPASAAITTQFEILVLRVAAQAVTSDSSGGDGGGGGGAEEEAVGNDDGGEPVSLSVCDALTGKEVVFFEDVDPTTMTVGSVWTEIAKKKPDASVEDMQLVLRQKSPAAAAAAGGGGGGGGGDPILFLENDDRTLASVGFVGTHNGDNEFTLQLVEVPPPTPEQIEERSREVYEAAEAGDEPRLQAAVEVRGADLNWHNPAQVEKAPLHAARR